MRDLVVLFRGCLSCGPRKSARSDRRRAAPADSQLPIDKDVVRRILAHQLGLSANRPTDRLGVEIGSTASQQRCGPTGSWSSWINTRAGSLGSAFMRARSFDANI